MELSPKQIKRNLEKLEDRKYSVEQDHNNRYFIFGAENLRNRIFDEPEQHFLHSLVSIHASDHAMAASVLLKLKPNPILIPVAPQLKASMKTKNFLNIKKAIERNQRINLLAYVSPNGTETISNRVVEPLSFNDDHSQLRAFEIKTRKEKSFKLDRIGQVEILKEPCKYRRLKNNLTDPFGFSGERQKIIKIQLSLLAKELLSENYPAAVPYLIQKNNNWYFHGPICNPTGIGRFILGLPGEINLVYGQDLKGYLMERKKQFKF